MSSTEPTPKHAAPARSDGTDVLICLLGFFGVVAAVNAVLMRAAVSTFAGVETPESYQAGLDFSREIAAAAGAGGAALAGEGARVQPRAGRDDWSRSSPRDAAGRPLIGLDASAQLVHPTDRRCDSLVPLDERATGGFRRTRRGRARPTGMLVIDLSRDGDRMFRSQAIASSCGEAAGHGRKRSISRSSCGMATAASRISISRSKASAAPPASARSRAG